MVETRGLTKVFRDDRRGDVVAVDHVDFYARPGEIHGVLGVNGAGKTTLLRMLATIIQPTEGSAIVAGHDVQTESTDVRSKIGFLSSSTALYGRLSGRETVTYFARLYGFTGSELKDRVEKAIQEVEAEEFAAALCDKMSTGQKQRISIARAIVHSPEVLFFDEPTAGLDIISSQTVMAFIERVRDQGKTVMVSTHIMSEVERLCDAISVVHRGVVRARGTLDMLREQTGHQSLEQVFLTLVDHGEEGR